MNLQRLLSARWLMIAILCSSQIIYAQNKTVAGRVTDQKDGSPVAGVSVSAKGTNIGTVTGSEGKFALSVPETANTLVFSAIGFGTREETITGDSLIVALESTAANLNEIVVIGYGTARKKDITGAVSTVSAKDFNRGALTTPSQLIQGKVAGVLVVNASGQPGAATTVRIRGNNSIRTGNQPLYVIDGVPIDGRIARPSLNVGFGNSPASDPLYFINPFDITSMDVLKDASATAIYGSRGSNGVIMITTRKGQGGAPRIDVNASSGISRLLRKYDVLNANEYRSALQSYDFKVDTSTGRLQGDFGGSEDALEAITRTAATQNYNVSVSGGNEAGKYRAGFGYYDQRGIILKTGLKKYTVDINGQYKFLESKKLSLDFNVMAAHNIEDIGPVSNDAGATGNLISQALLWNPTRPLRKADGTLDRPGGDIGNPLAMSEEFTDGVKISNILANASIGYKILDGLEYRFLYGINHQVGVRRAQLLRTTQVEGAQNRGIALYGNNELNTQLFTHTLNYIKDFSEAFSLNALLGYEHQEYNWRGASISGQDFASDDVSYTNILQSASQSSIRTSSFADPLSELQSFFGRAIVSLQDKYTLTATLRADGSSKFGKNNRYGYFPSFAAAWDISREPFLQGSGVFNQLKFRIGYGLTGNQEFPAGSAQEQYTLGQGSVALANVANPDLKWEATKQFNAGIDFDILKGRLFGSLDVFHKNTSDLLFNFASIQPAPASRYWINLPGKLINKGIELALNTTLLRANDMNWGFGVNASLLRNELQDYNGPTVLTGALSGQGLSNTFSQRLASGKPLNSFFVREFTGLDDNGLSTYSDKGNTSYFLGDPNPNVLLGISTDFNYKNWTIIVNANGALGHQIYNNTLNSVLPITNLGSRNIDASLIGGAVKENLTNAITPSSRYISDGDYLKLANASISYRLGNIGNTIKNLNISLTGQNLFIITGYKGFDPEVNTDKAVEGVPSFGIEYIPYPPARTILLGVNFSL